MGKKLSTYEKLWRHIGELEAIIDDAETEQPRIAVEPALVALIALTHFANAHAAITRGGRAG